MNHIVIS